MNMNQNDNQQPMVLEENGRLTIHSILDQMRWMHGIFFLIMQTFALTVEVFLRRKFGERYLDTTMVMLGYGLLTLTSLFFGQTHDFTGEGPNSLPLLVFAQAYLCVALMHKVETFHRNMKGERWHSQSEGLSHDALQVPARLVAGVISRIVPVSLLGNDYRERLRYFVHEQTHLKFEPLLVLLLGALLHPHNGPLGFYLLLAGFAMLIKGELKRHDDRRNVLDLVDQSIEAQHQKDVMTGLKQPEEAEGFHVYGAAMSQVERKSVEQAFARLNPELRRLISADRKEAA